MAEAAVQELKLGVRQSFAKAYSALKARELQTLRQIEAVWRHGGCGTLLHRDVCFDNEDKLFDEIRRFGVLHLDKLNVQSDIFIMEDYVSPNDDHMYSYKCLDELYQCKDLDSSLEATIEENALKQITNGNQCVCYVDVSPDEVPKKFRETNSNESSSETSGTPSDSTPEISEEKCTDDCEQTCVKKVDNEVLIVANEPDDLKVNCDPLPKANPTQDWLNQIINETETEPSEIIDLMEHSAIECS